MKKEKEGTSIISTETHDDSIGVAVDAAKEAKERQRKKNIRGGTGR